MPVAANCKFGGAALPKPVPWGGDRSSPNTGHFPFRNVDVRSKAGPTAEPAPPIQHPGQITSPTPRAAYPWRIDPRWNDQRRSTLCGRSGMTLEAHAAAWTLTCSQAVRAQRRHLRPPEQACVTGRRCWGLDRLRVELSHCPFPRRSEFCRDSWTKMKHSAPRETCRDLFGT